MNQTSNYEVQVSKIVKEEYQITLQLYAIAMPTLCGSVLKVDFDKIRQVLHWIHRNHQWFSFSSVFKTLKDEVQLQIFDYQLWNQVFCRICIRINHFVAKNLCSYRIYSYFMFRNSKNVYLILFSNLMVLFSFLKEIFFT